MSVYSLTGLNRPDARIWVFTLNTSKRDGFISFSDALRNKQARVMYNPVAKIGNGYFQFISGRLNGGNNINTPRAQHNTSSALPFKRISTTFFTSPRSKKVYYPFSCVVYSFKIKRRMEAGSLLIKVIRQIFHLNFPQFS